jgi:hypothetical protein
VLQPGRVGLPPAERGTEARGARSLLPEAPEQRSQWFSEFLVTLLISGPFAAWFVLVLPIRFFAWLAQPRYRSLRAGNRYGDLTWATRRATAWRVVRRLLSIAAGLTVLSFLGPAPRAAVGRALTTGVLIATPILAAIYLFTSLLGLLISMFAGPSRQGLYESSHGVCALLLGVGLGVAGAGSSWIVFMFFPAVFLLFAADRYGPVIALSPPGTRFPPIGAARQTLPNDVWQSRIREMAEGALCVVISATPYQINEGLDFELKMVDSELSHQRVLLVVGPWRKQTGQDRWRRFVAWTYRYSMFQPIAYPFVQPGAHVLAHTPSGWYAWGARRRTDRTYGACVDAALAQGLTEAISGIDAKEEYVAQLWAALQACQRPRSSRTALRRAGSSVMMPSAPARTACTIESRSLSVQT